jgi:Fic family protein
MMYLYDQPKWPNFYWDDARLSSRLAHLRHQQGRFLGRMEGLGFPIQAEAALQTLTQDIVKTSEIEGETLDRTQVRSSLARRLGLEHGAVPAPDRHVEGIVEMMLDAIRQYDQALNPKRLWAWHGALFPTGRSGLNKIHVGGWRTDARGPMQVISGAIGREKVHFEAPPAPRLNAEMEKFCRWFNDRSMLDPVLKSGLAHLWFVTLHPFDDGNGRIARAIADMALARSERSSQRFYSLSAQIRLERNDYYDALERAQKSTFDVSPWLEWFLGCLGRAIDGAELALGSVLKKAAFWEKMRGLPLNERQTALLNRLLDGFEGKLTSSKWAKIAKCSQDTAHRDILELIDHGLLVRDVAGGRSTSYSLAQGI